MNPTPHPTTPHPTPQGTPRAVGQGTPHRPTDPAGRAPQATPRGTPRPGKPAGWVYLIHTHDDPTKYVGQTTQPVPTRVNRHRRPLPQGGQTWGHEIKPGRAGYTILRRVESHGDVFLDAIALDLAEAEMIAEWEPTENTLRPDPQMFRDRLEAALRGNPTGPTPPPHTRPAGRPGRGPRATPRRPAGRTPRTPRRVPWAAAGRVVVAVLCGALALRLTVPMPWDWAPWAAVPIAVGLGPAVASAWARRILRGRPRRRRRRRTARRR